MGGGYDEIDDHINDQISDALDDISVFIDGRRYYKFDFELQKSSIKNINGQSKFENFIFNNSFDLGNDSLLNSHTLIFEDSIFEKGFFFKKDEFVKNRKFIFRDCKLENLDLSELKNTKFYFSNSELKNINFSYLPVRENEWHFSNSKFQNINFIGCDDSKISLTPQQREESYFSEGEKIKYFSNNETKESFFKVEREKEAVKEKNEDFQRKEKSRAKKGIEKLEEGFSIEEKTWLSRSVIIFLVLSFISLYSLFVFLGIDNVDLLYQRILGFLFVLFMVVVTLRDYKTNILSSKEKGITKYFNWQLLILIPLSLFGLLLLVLLVMFISAIVSGFVTMNTLLPTDKIIEVESINTPYMVIPFILLLFTSLYFSIYQYSRAKNLRIENQNKVALMHEFNILDLQKESNEKEEKMKSILPKYADIIFSKAIPSKNEKNLPLDEIIRLAEIFNKKT